jgi:hypothetical protein
MTETRKIAAILVADVVGYSRLAGADEDRTFYPARVVAIEEDDTGLRPGAREASRRPALRGRAESWTLRKRS